MATVERWTGLEVRALREAQRMSIEAFAAKLGVSDRMVSKWEARGETIKIRPVNQAALDTALASSSPEVHARFVKLTSSLGSVLPGQRAEEGSALPRQHQVRHPHDGKKMALVDAGVYLSGAGNNPVWLPAFYIDVYPVTNSDYERFVAATGHAPPQHWPKGRCPESIRDHPVVFVTWHDAAAYAVWAGKELPSSQQWEKAARGPRGDIYPWGSQQTPAKCNTRESGIGSTTPVTRYHSGVSPYGVYDMCGNAWEWTSTHSEPGRYELKAGAWTSPFSRVTPAAFNDASTEMLDDDTGFRCAVLAEDLRQLLGELSPS
ncbi:SUMF1/EgtB/PvdO family nonheme iron enzyme [Streptomyces sp. SBST2-5]|uniref:SUMF1/EgtB/PvdO family nonheme iron enzyme n=1 Tax=Streptomyces composti TaxID=2720025 RepID=A0ABX1A376_9ACTN|nr:SUMF1/EgtB/PvdO family nonheme iron enzyme [Streptomyces composti]NJP50869.1 SUMF1/EgtB/PvdO family nonheme iron enzyme [Streptomyces composti]